jgi:hypothetical protein
MIAMRRSVHLTYRSNSNQNRVVWADERFLGVLSILLTNAINIRRLKPGCVGRSPDSR